MVPEPEISRTGMLLVEVVRAKIAEIVNSTVIFTTIYSNNLHTLWSVLNIIAFSVYLIKTHVECDNLRLHSYCHKYALATVAFFFMLFQTHSHLSF